MHEAETFAPPGARVFTGNADRPVDIEVVGSDLVFGHGYTYAIEILKLDVDNTCLVPGDFGPLACVVPLDPPLCISIWPVVRARVAAAAAPLPRESRRASLLTFRAYT